MDDLVKRLRDPKRDWPEFGYDRTEAAAALEAKNAEIARLIELGDKLADAAESGVKAAGAIAAWDQLRNAVSRAAITEAGQ